MTMSDDGILTTTCPHGHVVSFSAPSTDPQLVGVVDGVEQFAYLHHDEMVVECNVPVNTTAEDGTVTTALCRAKFIVILNPIDPTDTEGNA